MFGKLRQWPFLKNPSDVHGVMVIICFDIPNMFCKKTAKAQTQTSTYDAYLCARRCHVRS